MGGMLQARTDLTSQIDLVDPEVGAAIRDEFERQQYTLELIPSENIASPAVLQALGSLLNNKYAEGYPGKRYYGGTQIVDRIETLAIDRAKALFGAEHANVQSHCGTTANYAVYAAVLNVGDTVMGMDLSQGGHLSHGSPVNFSGKLYHFVPYGVDPTTERIDYDLLEKQAKEVRPKMLLAGYSAYPRILDFERFAAIAKAVMLAQWKTPEFKSYAQAVVNNARVLAEGLNERKLRLVSGGTDNHLMLIDLRPLNLTGKKVQDTFDPVGITVNRNSIPFDTASKFNPSGIRLGSPSVTTRGMGPQEMTQIADMVAEMLYNLEDRTVHEQVRARSRALCERFPLPY